MASVFADVPCICAYISHACAYISHVCAYSYMFTYISQAVHICCILVHIYFKCVCTCLVYLCISYIVAYIVVYACI